MMGAGAEGFGTALTGAELQLGFVPPSSSDDDSVPRTASTAVNNETAGKSQETARKKLLYADVTQAIIDAFFVVYNKLGFGFLENVYVWQLSFWSCAGVGTRLLEKFSSRCCTTASSSRDIGWI